MPAVDLKTYLDSKPVRFVINTKGGKWKCQLHQDRAAYEKVARDAGITRTGSDLSVSSTDSA